MAPGRAARSCGPRRCGALLRAAAPEPAAAGDGTRAQPAARHPRHHAGRPPGLLRPRRAPDAPSRPSRRRGRALRERLRRRPRSRCPPTLPSSPASTRSSTASATTATSISPSASRRWPRCCAARGYRTAAFVSSFVLDRRYGLARGFETTTTGWRPRPSRCRPSRRSAAATGRRSPSPAGWSARRQRPVRSSPGSTSTTRTSPTSRPRPSATPSPSPTTARSPSRTPLLATVLDRLRRARPARPHARGGGGRPRREPRRPRRGDALDVRLRERHPCPADPLAARGPARRQRGERRRCGRSTSRRRSSISSERRPWPAPHARSLCRSSRAAGEPPPPAVYAETLRAAALHERRAAPRRCATSAYKLIDAPRPELYDLARDPGETRQPSTRDEPKTAGGAAGRSWSGSPPAAPGR